MRVNDDFVGIGIVDRSDAHDWLASNRQEFHRFQRARKFLGSIW